MTTSMLLLTLLLGPLLLVLGLMKIWLVLKRHKGRRFPFRDAVQREPGYSLRKAMERIWDELLQYVFLLPLYPLVMYAAVLQARIVRGEAPLFLIGLCAMSSVVVIGASLYKVWQLLGHLMQVRLGYAGEVIAGQALNQLMLQGYRVYHDVEFETFNVDHVVIGKGGVFVVETKLRTKRLADADDVRYKVRFDGKALYFPSQPNVPVTKPLNQARHEAKAVSRWLSDATGQSVSAQAVLVLPGWWIEGANEQGDVWVFNHKQLNRLPQIVEDGPVLSEARIRAMAHQLDSRCARDDLVPKVVAQTPNPLFQES